MNDISQISQADRNFEAFQALLPELLCNHAGKYALMSDGNVIDFFDSVADAVKFGQQKYGDIKLFSVQQVTAKTESLGFYSYAVRRAVHSASRANP